ncbi:hypothetical protein BKA80DRAFT_138622 [Phyllosticta citrichinensis]
MFMSPPDLPGPGHHCRSDRNDKGHDLNASGFINSSSSSQAPSTGRSNRWPQRRSPRVCRPLSSCMPCPGPSTPRRRLPTTQVLRCPSSSPSHAENLHHSSPSPTLSTQRLCTDVANFLGPPLRSTSAAAAPPQAATRTPARPAPRHDTTRRSSAAPVNPSALASHDSQLVARQTGKT